MLEETGVITALHGKLAEVQVQARSACGHCSARSGCGTSLVESLFPRRRRLLLARNEVGGRPGDRVVVGLDEAELQRASLLLYLVPVLGLMAGAIAGDRWSAVHGGSEGPGILLGLLGLVLSLWAVGRYSRRRHPRRVRILRVLSPGLGGVRVEGPA